jgi:hypothetical protein
MVAITGALLLLAVVAVFTDWRRGLFVAVPVALLQDPLRKLTPDQPVVYVVLVGVVFGAAALAATMSGISLVPRHIWGWRRYLAAPFGLFVAVVIFQAIHAFASFGNVVVPLIGLSAYLTSFVALCLVYQTVVRSPDNFLINFFRFYIVCFSLALTTIYLEYIGYDWSILGEVGQRLIIFDRTTGAKLSAYSGLFRASEVAAWHAATCVCFFAIWMVNRRLTLGKGLAATLFVLMIVGLGVVTGRRKFLVEIVVFASAYLTLLLYFGRGARLALLSAFIGVMGYFAVTLWVSDGPGGLATRSVRGEQYQDYVSRIESVFKDIPDRFTDLGLAPISWAYDEYGLLGAGLGVGSQGGQHFGATAQGAAEGGLGKIWLELGVPGFVIIAWLGWAFTRHIWATLKFVSGQSPQVGRIACGLTSFLLANIATFAVATQVYGDIFVLLLLGTALGALLATPVLAKRAVLQKQVLRLAPDSSSVLAGHPA